MQIPLHEVDVADASKSPERRSLDLVEVGRNDSASRLPATNAATRSLAYGDER